MTEPLPPHEDRAPAPTAAVPGPRGLRLLWAVGRMLADPLDRLAAITQTYGDVVRFGVGRHELTLLNHPDYIRHVLVTHHQRYARTQVLAELRPLLGDGLFTVDPARWKPQRRRLQPAFHHRHLATITAVVHDEVETLLAGWTRQTAPIDLQATMKGLTLAILTRTLFAPTAALDAPAVMAALDTVLAYASLRGHTLRLAWWMLPRPLRPPPPGQRAMHDALRVLDDAVAGLTAHCRTHRDEASTFMQILLDAHDAGSISAKRVRDEMMTLLFAGFDTVAQALTWTWYLLAGHPDAERRLHAELDATVGAADRLSVDDLGRLPHTRRVVLEALRLYPPAWAFFRTAQAHDVIGGYRIPAGSFVMVSPYLLHRHPGCWTRAEAFVPDRFAGDGAALERAFQYMPFGHGPHTCIGKRTALVEIQMILALMARTFRLRRTTTGPVDVVPGIIIQPKDGIAVLPERRVVAAVQTV